MITLWHGDCLELMKNIPDKSIDLVVTDCPYKVVQGGRVGSKTPKGGIFGSCHEDFKRGTVFKENNLVFEQWLPSVYRVLKDKHHCYIMINGRNLCDLQTKAIEVGFTYQNILVWDKGNKTPNRYYMQQLEFILMLTKNGSRDIVNMGTSNLLSIKNIIGNKAHPTEKPILLMEILIKNSSGELDKVLDPFMGSGTTGLACQALNRSFVGIEKDDKYFEIAKNRIFPHPQDR